jgi:uncharacterized protein (TIGR02453 family)
MKKRLAKSTLDFIQDLQENNQRDWFQENKVRYEAAKDDFLEFMQSVIDGASKFEPALEGQVAKDTMFRIYRDVRFSSNKSPYKDHLCAYLAEGGRKTINPGYYLHINPNNQSFMASGLWMPPPAELKAVRQEIDYNFDELKSIVEKPGFQKNFASIEGDKLKTNPKGYDSENPAINLLRHKSWNVVQKLPDDLLLSDKFYDTVIELIKTVKPFIDFLIRPLHDLAENKAEKIN